MKQISHLLLILLCVFILNSHSSTSYARLLPHYDQGDQQTVTADGITYAADPSIKTKEDDIFNLMGLEETNCEEKDEECMKRRMIAEAHLDYIYTQRHKSKGSP